MLTKVIILSFVKFVVVDTMHFIETDESEKF